MDRIDGERLVALVTGASRGIGRAIAVELARRGMHVWIGYRENESAARETLGCLSEHGGAGTLAQVDLRSAESVAQLFARLRDESGRLDTLVNNAAVTRDGPVARMRDEDWNEVVETSLGGAFRCIRPAVRLLRKSPRASIVNVASSGAVHGNPGQANYAAAKAGLLGMMRSLSRELAPQGIRVNAVIPGFVRTDLTAGLPPEHWRRILDETPTGRLSEPEDIARAIAFLAGEEARNITGQALVVDGGRI
jgi:3-oxoacyl-[acyl-carrier protein] reductase